MKTQSQIYERKTHIMRRYHLVIITLTALFFCGTAISAAEDNSPGTIARKAVESGNLAKVKEMIQNDPALLFQIIEKKMPDSFTTYDATLLHFATISEQLAIVKFLLEQGADPTVKDSDNMTPIGYGAGRNNREITRYLWANGSTDPAEDCMELSPFQYNLTKLAGSEVSREKMQLVQQRAQIMESIVTRLQSVTRGMNMKDYRLEIVDRKINDFYMRSQISDYTPYKEDDVFGKKIKGSYHLFYAGQPHSEITDEDFDNLATLIPNIYMLDLLNIDTYTDDGLKHISRMNELRVVLINLNHHITDDGLKHLGSLKKLRTLHITNCNNISDAGLVHLKELTTLESLDLSGNKKITEAGIASLQEALPDCNISPEPKNKGKVAAGSNNEKPRTTAAAAPPKKAENSTNRPSEAPETDAQTLAKKEVDLDRYNKAAGFEPGDRSFTSLLKYGTPQLQAKEEELQKKLRTADEFDKPGIQKQLDGVVTQARKNQEEIKGKVFHREFDDCSPSNVKTDGKISSFTLYVSKDFLPIGSDFGKFITPFPGVKAAIMENQYGIPERAAADVTGKVLPRWNSITISGDTDSIKELVRGMRENPKAYSLKLWFNELQGLTNEVRVPDFNNPFSPGRVQKEFLVVAKILQIQIIDKENRVELSYSGGGGTKTTVSAKQNGNTKTTASAKRPKETGETYDETLETTASSEAPALNKPDEWMAPLRDAEDLKPFAEVQRYIALMEYADAMNNKALYLQSRSEFFKSLKREVPNALTRIEFILGVWPGMMRHKNFDGLKAAMTDIDVMMDRNKVKSSELWAYYNAVLAGFALAMNDKDASDMYLKAGGSYEAKFFVDLVNAIAWKPINADKVFDVWSGAGSLTNTKNRFYYFCTIAIHLAQKGDAANYTKFMANAKKRSQYFDNIAYAFAIGDATLGEFDRARLHWKQYHAKDSKLWDTQYCLSSVMRKEFLSGEFRGWNTKEQVIIQLSKEKDALAESIGGSALPQFYFDYGRGLARHKTNQEIMSEYGTLSGELDEADLAFFMAGVATGVLDKKTPAPKRAKQASATKVRPDDAESNQQQPHIVLQPARTATAAGQESPETNSPEYQPQPDTPRTPNVSQPPRRNGERLRRAAEIYSTVRRFI